MNGYFIGLLREVCVCVCAVVLLKQRVGLVCVVVHLVLCVDGKKRE